MYMHSLEPTAMGLSIAPLGADTARQPATSPSRGRTLLDKVLSLSRSGWMTLMAIGLSLTGMAMLLLALWLPPRGSIESSVLVAYGEVMTFVGALLGISYTRR